MSHIKDLRLFNSLLRAFIAIFAVKIQVGLLLIGFNSTNSAKQLFLDTR